MIKVVCIGSKPEFDIFFSSSGQVFVSLLPVILHNAMYDKEFQDNIC